MSGSTSVVRFLVEFFLGLLRTSKPLCSHKQLTVPINLRRTESADCFDVLIPQKCLRSYRVLLSYCGEDVDLKVDDLS